jgi:hypothetical protein
MSPKARRDELLIQEVGDELVVYDEQRHQAHSLNRTAALVWRLCDGQTTVEELTSLLQYKFGLQADEELVWLTLNRLERANLLLGRPTRPTEAARITRRQVVRKVGFVGSLSFLLPIVSTLIVPTPAMAASATPVDCSGPYIDKNGNSYCLNLGCSGKCKVKTDANNKEYCACLVSF